MHGIVLKGLKDFVVENYGVEGWQQVQEEAGLDNRIYVPVTEYPDEEAVALVAAACKVTGQRPPEVMAAFGQYLVTPLLQTYGVHVDGEWSSMELLANVEEYIHEALRAKQLSEFTPPSIAAQRIGEDSVVLHYDSERELCPLVRGILEGVADHYDETFEIEERECRLEGALRCTFHVARVPPGRDVEAGAETEPSRWVVTESDSPPTESGSRPESRPAGRDETEPRRPPEKGRPAPDGSGIDDR